MKMDWNDCLMSAWSQWLVLLTHSNYEDGLKQIRSSRKAKTTSTFDAFQLWRWIETIHQLWYYPKDTAFWRIPIMKMDWNSNFTYSRKKIAELLTHSNYEDGLKRGMEGDAQITGILLTHSNYEDGLKRVLLKIFFITCLALLTHSNYEDGLKLRVTT